MDNTGDMNNKMNDQKYKVFLASNSPRRRELLAGLDIPFEVKVIPDIDESYPATLDAYEVAGFISRKKAAAYHGLLAQYAGQNGFLKNENEARVVPLVITADTVVIAPADSRAEEEQANLVSEKPVILGKPKDADEARAMLRLLSGKTHHVVTGVCLTTLEKQRNFSVTTEVTFKNLTDQEIDYYIEHYKPFDKAGAYGIQEWIGYIGCTGLKGSYYNVMGLPVQRIYEEMKNL